MVPIFYCGEIRGSQSSTALRGNHQRARDDSARSGIHAVARRGRSWAMCVLVMLGIATPAQAAFPGGNGLIAFQTTNGIGVADPGGTPILLGPPATRAGFTFPAWSPDGERLALHPQHARLRHGCRTGSHVRCVGEKGSADGVAGVVPDNLHGRLRAKVGRDGRECRRASAPVAAVPDGHREDRRGISSRFARRLAFAYDRYFPGHGPRRSS